MPERADAARNRARILEAAAPLLADGRRPRGDDGAGRRRGGRRQGDALPPLPGRRLDRGRAARRARARPAGAAAARAAAARPGRAAGASGWPRSTPRWSTLLEAPRPPGARGGDGRAPLRDGRVRRVGASTWARSWRRRGSIAVAGAASTPCSPRSRSTSTRTSARAGRSPAAIADGARGRGAGRARLTRRTRGAAWRRAAVALTRPCDALPAPRYAAQAAPTAATWRTSVPQQPPSTRTLRSCGRSSRVVGAERGGIALVELLGLVELRVALGRGVRAQAADAVEPRAALLEHVRRSATGARS